MVQAEKESAPVFLVLFHRATTSLRVLPDFLVIGVMKGGTTSSSIIWRGILKSSLRS